MTNGSILGVLDMHGTIQIYSKGSNIIVCKRSPNLGALNN